MAKLRRLYNRYKVNYEFKYSYNNKPSKCIILDISENGMLLKVPQILQPGDLITLIFEEIDYNLSLLAKVIYSNINYIGVSFVLDDYEDIEFIKHFIHEIKDKNRL